MSDAMVHIDLPTTRQLDDEQRQRLATVLALHLGTGDDAPTLDVADLTALARYVTTGELAPPDNNLVRSALMQSAVGHSAGGWRDTIPGRAGG